jgi:metabotropic X receptor
MEFIFAIVKHHHFSKLQHTVILMMMMPLAVTALISASISRPAFNFTWPTKKASDVEGDLTLGGLMMIHERQENFTCGPVMPQGGIQVKTNKLIIANLSYMQLFNNCLSISFKKKKIKALETMLYTIDQINPILFKTAGFTIGAHILDDCDKDTYGLEQAVAFIKGN